MTRDQKAWAQGLVWTITGIWPLVSYGTFTKVTGPKREPWLVKTMGLLIAVVGGTLLVSAKRRRVSDEVVALGAFGAGALATADVVYAARGRISPVYLLDAAMEIAFTGAWLAEWWPT